MHETANDATKVRGDRGSEGSSQGEGEPRMRNCSENFQKIYCTYTQIYECNALQTSHIFYNFYFAEMETFIMFFFLNNYSVV